MFDRVYDSMTICHATFPLTDVVHDYLHSITTTDAAQPVNMAPPHPVYSHPKALKTIHMAISREYLIADQEMLEPRLPIPKDQQAISKMI